MTIDPTSLMNAAEAIAEDLGFDAAIEELRAKLEDTSYNAEQERNAILHVIGSLRRRRDEFGFYSDSSENRLDAPVPPADDRKPDPSHPYRYVCPDCEGQVRRRMESTTYQCSFCLASWRKEDLHDRKPKERPVA